PHDRAFGLCATALFAAAVAGDGCRHGADLLHGAAACHLRRRVATRGRAGNLAAHGDFPSTNAAALPVVSSVGDRSAGDRLAIRVVHARVRVSICTRSRWHLEGTRASRRVGNPMITPVEARSGKGHRDENFPVASRLIHPRHRAPILAFYEFVRTADDIADHSRLDPQEKLALLDRLEAGLLGNSEADPVALALRSQLALRQLSPRHAQDLLTAFRMDVTKLRYRDWEDLIGYCTYSAMPV